jgi:hypothetical protein
MESDVQTADKFIRFRIESNCVTSTVDLFVIAKNLDSRISLIFGKKRGKEIKKGKISSAVLSPPIFFFSATTFPSSSSSRHSAQQKDPAALRP